MNELMKWVELILSLSLRYTDIDIYLGSCTTVLMQFIPATHEFSKICYLGNLTSSKDVLFCFLLQNYFFTPRLFFGFRNFLFSLRKLSNFFYCLLKTCFSLFWTVHWIISFCSLFSLINCVPHQSLECQVCLCWRNFLRKTKFLGSEVTIHMYQIRL